MTPAISNLERKRFLQTWWWFDPSHAGQKGEASLAWEMIRRTRSYSALWRKFTKETLPLLQHEGTPKLSGAFQNSHLFQRSNEALGEPYFNWIMKGFNPDLTWLELAESQRLTARGFLLGDGVAFKVNAEYVLPGQVVKKPRVSGGLLQLVRDASGEMKLLPDKPIAQSLGLIEDTELFRSLPLAAPGEYVYVIFDTRGSREALLESFDAAMLGWLHTAPPGSGEKMDAVYWAKVAKNHERLVVWRSPDGTPVEFWTPENPADDGDRIRAKMDEQALLPSDDLPRAIFMISSRHNPATVRAAFHTKLKAAQFKKWHPEFVAFWKTLTVSFTQLPKNRDGSDRVEFDERGKIIYERAKRPVFDAREHLPAPHQPRRSTRRKNAWLGLAAHDVVAGGLPLGKNTTEGAFLLGITTTSYDGLHNAQRATQKWLRELDESAGRLDKTLGHWNNESKKLASCGFFKAAAGEPLADE